jgi:WD40 repeat protein
VSFTPDSKFLIAYRYELFLYRVSDWKAVPQLPDVPQGIVRYFQSRDGKWAILGEADGKMLLWDLAAKKAKATLDTGHYPSFVEFSPDQTQVAVASTTTPPRDYDKANGECRIRVWDVKTARLVCELKPYDLTGPENIEGLLWCPDGKYVLAATKPGGSDSREVGVWNVATGRHRGDFTGALHLTGMALTPDGKTLIAGSKDNKIHLWDFVAGMKRIQAYEATLPALPQEPRQ